MRKTALTPTREPLALFVRKMELWRPLGEAERRAVMALPHQLQFLEAGATIVREGDAPTHSFLLVQGYAYRSMVGPTGLRGICALQMPGDILDLQNAILRNVDHNVITVTQAEVVRVPRRELVEAAFAFPQLGLAMWCDTLVDASIFRRWMFNNSRRRAQKRLAHLICEFAVRLEKMGLGERKTFEFPLTQDHLADATGMTPVHVNRTLMELQALGLFVRDVRDFSITDWEALASIGEFDEAYLHFAPISSA